MLDGEGLELRFGNAYLPDGIAPEQFGYLGHIEGAVVVESWRVAWPDWRESGSHDVLSQVRFAKAGTGESDNLRRQISGGRRRMSITTNHLTERHCRRGGFADEVRLFMSLSLRPRSCTVTVVLKLIYFHCHALRLLPQFGIATQVSKFSILKRCTACVCELAILWAGHDQLI